MVFDRIDLPPKLPPRGNISRQITVTWKQSSRQLVATWKQSSSWLSDRALPTNHCHVVAAVFDCKNNRVVAFCRVGTAAAVWFTTFFLLLYGMENDRSHLLSIDNSESPPSNLQTLQASYNIQIEETESTAAKE